ncbi:hypothetical protein D0859_02994 [Hortaea werneckii]|uniref:Uncharacterized protein n=1 Tax=Hortaea werneckii TaxID=91943 RepID=A0A3M7J4X8_HORWE|nr:hypothetical protein D0859_02994 [Hortaea werneckii]
MASSFMPIPKRKQPVRPAVSSSWSSSAASSYSSPSSSSLSNTPSTTKGKFPAIDASPPRITDEVSPRRPSLLGSSLSKSEHTVVNLAHRDGPPRLVGVSQEDASAPPSTCTRQKLRDTASQGFDWNQELFLPSYADYEYDSTALEHKQEPVEDIVLSDEEAAAMLPR